MYVKIGVFETAVFAVDVKPCGNLNFLRADVFKFHGFGIFDIALLIRVSGESGHSVAVGVNSAFGECPDIFHLEILGVRELEVEGHHGVVKLHDFGRLILDGEYGNDVINQDGVGFGTDTVYRESHPICACLFVLMQGIGIFGAFAITEVPSYGSGLG